MQGEALQHLPGPELQKFRVRTHGLRAETFGFAAQRGGQSRVTVANPCGLSEQPAGEDDAVLRVAQRALKRLEQSQPDMRRRVHLSQNLERIAQTPDSLAQLMEAHGSVATAEALKDIDGSPPLLKGLDPGSSNDDAHGGFTPGQEFNQPPIEILGPAREGLDEGHLASAGGKIKSPSSKRRLSDLSRGQSGEKCAPDIAIANLREGVQGSAQRAPCLSNEGTPRMSGQSAECRSQRPSRHPQIMHAQDLTGVRRIDESKHRSDPRPEEATLSHGRGPRLGEWPLPRSPLRPSPDLCRDR